MIVFTIEKEPVKFINFDCLEISWAKNRIAGEILEKAFLVTECAGDSECIEVEGAVTIFRDTDAVCSPRRLLLCAAKLPHSQGVPLASRHLSTRKGAVCRQALEVEMATVGR